MSVFIQYKFHIKTTKTLDILSLVVVFVDYFDFVVEIAKRIVYIYIKRKET